MKHLLLLTTILLLAYSQANSQILDFSNKEPKIIPLQYDSTYYVLPEYASIEEYAGLKGQRVVDSNGDVWIITDYISNYEMSPSEFKLMNHINQKTKTLNIYDIKGYYLEAGFERFKNRLIGNNIFPYIGQVTKFVAFNDTEILIRPKQGYEITDVKYAKFGQDDYAPIVEIDSKGYYKLETELNESITLNGNARNNQIEFNIGNDFINRNVGSGVGDYDGSGNGVFGRKIVKRNWRGLFKGTNQLSEKGTVALKVCIDRKGDVKYTEILFDETTSTDRTFLKNALDASKGYKFQADSSAPKEQCGKLVFNM